jgi:hypothetical protein
MGLDALGSIFEHAQFTVLPTRHSYSIIPSWQSGNGYVALHNGYVALHNAEKAQAVAILPQYKAGGACFGATTPEDARLHLCMLIAT